MSDHAVVLTSGGMVSAVTACLAQREGNELTLIHVSYDQTSEEQEYRSVTKLAANVGGAEVVSVVADFLNSFGRGRRSNVGEMRRGEPSDAEYRSGYLPFRDGNLLGLGIAYAETHGADSLFIGSHADEGENTATVPPEFYDAFQEAANLGTANDVHVEIRVPFAESSRSEIVERGLELGTPFEVTWDCHRETPPACGTCVACRQRLNVFEEVGADDPLQYENETQEPS